MVESLLISTDKYENGCAERCKPGQAYQNKPGNIAPIVINRSTSVDDRDDNANDWSNDHQWRYGSRRELVSFWINFASRHERRQNQRKNYADQKCNDGVDHSHANKPIDRQDVMPESALGTIAGQPLDTFVNSAEPADQA